MQEEAGQAEQTGDLLIHLGFAAAAMTAKDSGLRLTPALTGSQALWAPGEACWHGAGSREQADGLVSLRVRAGRSMCVQMGMQPHVPPPAQPLRVLNAMRSDYLEVVHLLHGSLCLRCSVVSLGT